MVIPGFVDEEFWGASLWFFLLVAGQELFIQIPGSPVTLHWAFMAPTTLGLTTRFWDFMSRLLPQKRVSQGSEWRGYPWNPGFY